MRLITVLVLAMLIAACTTIDHYKVKRVYQGTSKYGSQWNAWVIPNAIEGDSAVIWEYSMSVGRAALPKRHTFSINKKVVIKNYRNDPRGGKVIKLKAGVYDFSMINNETLLFIDIKNFKLSPGDSVVIVGNFIKEGPEKAPLLINEIKKPNAKKSNKQ